MGFLCPKPDTPPEPDFEKWEEPPIQAKVIVLGPKSVGKTTMIQYFMQGDNTSLTAA